MIRLLLAAVALFAVAGAATAQQASPIPSDMGGRVAAGFVRPAVEALLEAATAQRDSIATLCERPSAQALEAARADFAVLVPAWGRVSVLRFGPLLAGNRFERLFFWPDPRGVTLRQVQGVLAGEDAAAADPDAIAGKSVAVQGLPALEFLLHGTGSDELAAAPGSYRCAYAGAVAGNVAAMAAGLAADWRDGTAFARSFTEPAAGKDPYRSTAEVAGEIVKALGTALQFTRSAELLPALGDSADEARGKRAPLWRSDLTFVLVAGRIDGMIGLLEATGLPASDDDLTRDVATSIRFELRNAAAALGKIARPAEQAFADEEDRGRIAYAALALDGAEHLLSEQLAGAIGLTMGFNALDGD